MSRDTFTVDVDGVRTTAVAYAPTAAAAAATLVLAHGAGAPQTHPWMVEMAGALAARGLTVVTFNFLYAEQKRRVPDRADRLEATWRAALGAARSRGLARGPLFIGGKSMGGRIATQVAAAGEPGLSGLVLLGYPLHPPGRPDQLRAAHLPRIAAPMLIVQGSRDAFGSPEELAPIVAGLSPGTRVFVIPGGDHSFKVAKRRGEPAVDVVALVADEVARFVDAPTR